METIKPGRKKKKKIERIRPRSIRNRPQKRQRSSSMDSKVELMRIALRQG